MSTSLLYHAFGVRGYTYTRTTYVGGGVEFHITKSLEQCRCAACGSGLTGAELEGALLACPRCAQRYNVVRAGRGSSGSDKAAGLHLDPLPLLTENGGVRIAVPAQAVS